MTKNWPMKCQYRPFPTTCYLANRLEHVNFVHSSRNHSRKSKACGRFQKNHQTCDLFVLGRFVSFPPKRWSSIILFWLKNQSSPFSPWSYDENHTGYGLCSHTTTVVAACGGAISVTKQSCAALISKGDVGTGRFPTTIFSTTQRCIVGTMLWPVATKLH